MSASKVISLVLFCIVLQQCSSVQQMCTFWKGVYYPPPYQSLVFDRQSLQSPKFLYAVCYPSADGKTCNLIRDKNESFQGGNNTCNVNIKPKTPGAALGDKLQVVPFGDDRAILVWLERTNTETKFALTSVKFSDCSWHQVRMNVDHSFDDDVVLDNIHLLTGQNTYEVAYLNSRQCGNKYCKFSVNVDTNELSQPAAWLPVDRNNHIVDLKTLDTPDQGAVAIETTSNEVRFSILQGNAKKVLKVYGTSDSSSVASDTSNQLISTCHLSSGTLNCALYDQSGASIVDSTNQLQGNLRVLSIHNLRGGAGLLVLLENKAQNRVEVLRIDMKGKQVGKIDVNKFECDRNLNAVAGNFWENGEQYCTSLACYENDEASARKNDRGHLTATAKCFYLRNLQPVS